MKKTLLILLTLFGTFYVMGQGMEQRIREEKVKYIRERIELKTEQEKSFWGLYEAFNTKKRDIRIEISQNRLGLRKSTISEDEALGIINTELELKQDMVDLEKEYIEKYSEVLSPTQIIRLYQAEDDFNRVVMQRLRQMRGNQRGPGNN